MRSHRPLGASCGCAQLARRASQAYADFEYHVVFHQVHDFCAVDMGGFYLDALKDRLYCDGAASWARRSRADGPVGNPGHA